MGFYTGKKTTSEQIDSIKNSIISDITPDINTAKTTAQTALTTAQDAAETAEDAATAAETASGTAEDAAETAQTALTAAQTASTTAETAKTAAMQSLYDRTVSPSGKIYGAKFPNASYSGTPAGERTESAVGLTAAVSTDETAGVNDFDNEPCFMFTRVNGYLNTDGDFVETAIEGDPAFSVDGSNGDVYVRWGARFFKYIVTDTHTEIQVTDMYRPNDGWCPYGIFVSPNGRIKRYAYIAAYEMGYNTDGLAASISGVPTAHNTYANRNATTAGLSHNTQLTEIRKKGAQYCGMTTKDVAFLQDMFCVEFATRHSQSVMSGCTSLNTQIHPAVAETGVSRVIVSNANAAKFPVGCTISVGVANASNSSIDRGNASMNSIVNRKRVLSQESYDDNNTALNIDTGSDTFDTTLECYISTMPWYTGTTDNVKGTSGSSTSNTNGYYPMKYRGVENLWGNVWTIMSDVIIGNYKPYICYDCTKFATSATDDYTELGYTLATTAGWAKEMGSDSNHPSVRLPVTVGGGSTTYYCDYYNIAAGACKELLFGGSLYGGGNAGLFSWYGYYAVSAAGWYIGSRLSTSGRSGVAA